ncbi:MAG: ABC transporter ATP-binding protein [Solirubrobacteraceae bacterium]|nr:ABC transporter ATP-binding protein [Solirubrobacteraceae bacterium]
MAEDVVTDLTKPSSGSDTVPAEPGAVDRPLASPGVAAPLAAFSSATPDVPTRLEAKGVSLAYDDRVISEGLDLRIPAGSFTVIVGPNACGKSTALRALARMLKPKQGSVLLDGQVISSLPAKQVARTLGLLPQSSVVPDGITVRDLVGRGRFPHQGLLRQWSSKDESAVQHALAATGVSDLENRFVDELSGGQRQRVWLAMVLAQETELLLLDEPTTFLDITHQYEVLDLCAELRESGDRTLVAVLHDLNQAARYATHIIAMKQGQIVAQGPPAEVVTPELVEAVFDLKCVVVPDPATGTPMVVATGRGERSAAAKAHAAELTGR